MSEVAQIAIHELAASQAPSFTIRSTKPGFREWRASHAAFSSATLRTISDDERMVSWFSHINNIGKTVPSLGCYELSDIRLRGHGLLSFRGQHVREVSHIADVAADDAQNYSPQEDLDTISSDIPGVSIIGPGYKVYGHWLVDFIPRVKTAQALYGQDLGGAVIPLPADTPEWAMTLLTALTGIGEGNILHYDISTEQIDFERLVVPTYAHGSYHFHPLVAEIYPLPVFQKPSRRICISRVNYESNTSGVLKKFVDRNLFEEHAVSRGYELIAPELLTLQEQIATFRSSVSIVGEYGSALHNALFSPSCATIGMIRCPNDVQLRIAALHGQSVVLLLPEREWIADTGAQAYSLPENSIEQFFDVMSNMSPTA